MNPLKELYYKALGYTDSDIYMINMLNGIEDEVKDMIRFIGKWEPDLHSMTPMEQITFIKERMEIFKANLERRYPENTSKFKEVEEMFKAEKHI